MTKLFLYSSLARVLDVLVTEVVLDCSRVVTVVSEPLSGGVA